MTRSYKTGLCFLAMGVVLLWLGNFYPGPAQWLAAIYYAGFLVCLYAHLWESRRRLKEALRQIKLEDDVHKVLKLMAEYREAGPVPAEDWIGVLQADHGWTREYCERLLQYCVDKGWISWRPSH